MQPSFAISIAGTPRPQPRPRKIRGKWVSTASGKAQMWKNIVLSRLIETREQIGAAPLFSAAVRVTLQFHFAAPQHAQERIDTPHTQGPDKDNLEKLILDALQKARIISDDCIVSQGPVSKWWAKKSGVSILIENIEQERKPLDLLVVGAEWLR